MKGNQPGNIPLKHSPRQVPGGMGQHIWKGQVWRSAGKLLLGTIPLLYASAQGQDAATGPACPPDPACSCEPQTALQANHRLEFSFGTTQNFNNPSRWEEPGRRILPTTSATLLAEVLLSPRWALTGFFNLPLVESRVLQADGTMTWEAADPVVALGGRWTPLSWPMLKGKAQAGVQVGAFVGTTVASLKGDTVVPVVSARLHLYDATGLAIYIGPSWAFVRESLALSYGLGYRF